MDPKELRGLYEAYSEVYAPVEEGLKPLPKEKMARQAQRAHDMEDRAAAAGDEKETNRQMQRRIAMQMPSSRRTILDKKKMGEEVEIEEASYSAKAARAGKDIGKPGKAFAKIAKEAGKRYGSKERGEKVAGAVLAKLRAEDVEIDEAVKGESSERRKALAAERKAGHRPKSAKEGENYASHKIAQMAYVKRQRMGEDVDIFDVVLEFLQVEGYVETLEEAEWMMANVIDEEAIEIILGEEQLDELSHDTYRSVAKAQSKKVGALQDAGNYGAADKSQDRLDRTKRLRKKSFVGPKAPGARNPYAEEYMDEAQEARNNPEKYEAGEKKKSAPVRGERTPMPPRGDKRREDFEKWYAANVR